MQSLFLTLFWVTTFMCYVEGQSLCKTPSGTPGQCILLTECAALESLMIKVNRTEEETDLIKKSQCGSSGRKVKVCCPEPCYTPDGKEGQCINIHACSHLVQLLKQSLNNTRVPEHTVKFVQNSRCDSNDQYSVCCGPAFKTLAPPEAIQCLASALPPAPTSDCCGIETYVAQKIFIFGAEETSIDQFPWLALIEYKQRNKIKLLCGGTLISARYVLTAGHCVDGDILNSGTPVNVRLGEHDTSNDGIDCVNVDGGGTDCNEGTTIIPIEKITPHPDYNPYNSQRRHNIALIRLKTFAPYTDFIRPICLPSTDLTELPPSPLPLYTAGWGKYNNDMSLSRIKLHVELPYVAASKCQSAYQQIKRKVDLWNGQLCAGGDKTKETCRGDAGGPLMFRNGKIHEIVGVVSFGPASCEQSNIPGVYTKVFHYIPWIWSVMKP